MLSESAFEKRRWQSPNELIENAGFRWQVAADGYRWEDEKTVYPPAAPPGNASTRRVLVPRAPIWAKDITYDPLAEGGLYVTFANTPDSEPELLRFANRWGYLRVQHGSYATTWMGYWPNYREAPAELPVAGSGARVVVPAERFGVWRMEVAVMREALGLWGPYSNGNRKLVARRLEGIIFESEPLPHARSAGLTSGDEEDGGYWAHVQTRWIRCLRLCVDLLLPAEDQRLLRTDFPSLLGFLDAGESITGHDRALATMKRLRRVLAAAPVPVMEIALHLLQEEIDLCLRAETHACLNWDRRRGRPVMGLTPRSLLGAMWLQFAQQVTGQASHRPCKVCGKWLTLSKDDYGFRSDREFCSAACRQKDYRAKIKEARRLKAEGQTVRQIAKHFGTTTDTINNWLTKEK
jgi:hypothetical protein